MNVYVYDSGKFFTHLGFICGFFSLTQSVPVIGWTSNEIADEVMRNNIFFLSFINRQFSNSKSHVNARYYTP